MGAKSTYIQGEAAEFKIADASYTSVTLRYGADAAALTLADGVWSCSVDTASMTGKRNWAMFADGKVVDSGSFYVRPLVSKWQAVVDEIDRVMQGAGRNGKMSVSIGDVSITNASFDEMRKFREYYQSLADSDEGGVGASGGPWVTMGVYA